MPPSSTSSENDPIATLHGHYDSLYPAGRDWGPEEKGMTEDEMAGWHLRLDGHEFE